jgi:hypothetical protein
MDSRIRMIAAVGAVLLASGSAAASAGVAVASGSNGWGTAREVPGTAALNQGGEAGVASVSCAAAGNCSAGGSYTDSSGRIQAFVVSQVGGTWHPAIEVPGTAALNQGGVAVVASVSCASAGNCSAGGDYRDGHGLTQAFVVGEAHGTWGKAEQVPGLAALNTGGLGLLVSLSCGSAGNCSAGGRYSDSSANSQAYVVSEVNGTWGKAEEVPGLAALNAGGFAAANSVSCGAAGNCSAGGLYTDGSGHTLAFVVSEAHGTWRTATNVPGLAALNTGGSAVTVSVSCASAGNCGAGGGYTDSSGHGQAFVVSEVNGTWRTATRLPGVAALNAGGNAQVTAVSCASAGDCGAVGGYTDGSGHAQAFVASEMNGTWRTAEEVPGLAALNAGGNAAIASVSCASAGHCGAAGRYKDSAHHIQVFVVSES